MWSFANTSQAGVPAAMRRSPTTLRALGKMSARSQRRCLRAICKLPAVICAQAGYQAQARSKEAHDVHGAVGGCLPAVARALESQCPRASCWRQVLSGSVSHVSAVACGVLGACRHLLASGVAGVLVARQWPRTFRCDCLASQGWCQDHWHASSKRTGFEGAYARAT